MPLQSLEFRKHLNTCPGGFATSFSLPLSSQMIALGELCNPGLQQHSKQLGKCRRDSDAPVIAHVIYIP